MILRRKVGRGLIFLLFSLACGAAAQQMPAPAVPAVHQKMEHWVASWGASQQIPEPRNTLPAEDLTNATMRQIIHLSLGGERLRVRLSNAFGTTALHLTAVHIARPVSPASSRILPGSDRALTFNGAPDVIIPPGAEYISDPIDYPMKALSDLAITFYEVMPPARETSHPGSRATTYYTHGNLVSAEDLPGARTIEHWYTIAGLDVTAAPAACAVVALGDSITDGHAATTNGNNRWTDVLARDLQNSAKTRNVAVVNVGTGGNRLLTYGLGPDALARFDRDVLARASVRYLIVFEGVNDIGTLHGAFPPGFGPPHSAPPPAGAGTTMEGAAGASGTGAAPAPSEGTAVAGMNGAGGANGTSGAVPRHRRPFFRFPAATPEQHEQLVKSILGAYEQIVIRAHAAGIRVIGATITPFGGSGYGRSPANEADREKINAWILTPGHFDAVIDFAKVIADPQDPSRIAPQFDSGDHLHPSPAGYRAMGESIPLTLFEGLSR